jgi:hypothetical protein
VALAVLAILLRNVFFERFVREWRSSSNVADDLVRDLAAGTAGADDIRRAIERTAEAMARRDKRFADGNKEDPELVKRLAQQLVPQARTRVVDACYFAWLDQPNAGPDNRILKGLLDGFAKETIFRFQRTLAVGNLQQRERLPTAAAALAKVDSRAALDFLDTVRRRAQRRGEDDLRQKADDVIHNLRP